MFEQDSLFEIEPERTRALVDPRAELPAGFPPALERNAAAVFGVLQQVAAHHNARVVTTLAIGNLMMARPFKRHVQCAYDFAAWAAAPPRPIKCVVSSYRTWLDRSPDCAGKERLPEDGPLPENVKPLRRGHDEEQVERLRRMRLELHG